MMNANDNGWVERFGDAAARVAERAAAGYIGSRVRPGDAAKLDLDRLVALLKEEAGAAVGVALDDSTAAYRDGVRSPDLLTGAFAAQMAAAGLRAAKRFAAEVGL